MQQTMRYSVGGEMVDVARNRRDEFMNDAGANGDTPDEVTTYRVKGRDGMADEDVHVAASKFDQFKADADANGDTFVPVRNIRFANGESRSFTTPELAKFLRSKEFREGDKYAEDRAEGEEQGSVAEAAIGGAVSGAVEGAVAGAKATGSKVLTTLPKVGTGIARATGNVLRVVGANDYGENLVAAADEADQSMERALPTSTAEHVGYEDWGTKTGDFFGNVAEMSVKFLPAQMAGIAPKVLMETMFASDGINAYADAYDTAKENGAGDLKANTLGMVAGLANYFGGKALMKAGGVAKNIKNQYLRELATAATSSGILGAQSGANQMVGNVAEGKPVMQGVVDAAVHGGLEGFAFHGANMLPRLGKIQQQYKVNKEQMQFAKETILDAAANNPAALDQMMASREMDAVVRKRRDGEDVSRKMGETLDLPGNMSVAERNEVVDSVIKYRDETAKANARRIDEQQSNALTQDIAATGVDIETQGRVYERIVGGLKDAKILDDPKLRERVVADAVAKETGKTTDVRKSQAEERRAALKKETEDLIEKGRKLFQEASSSLDRAEKARKPVRLGSSTAEPSKQSGEGFKLESVTAEQIEAEKERARQKEEIRRRQEAPLKGGRTEEGQTLLDLGGAEGEDLFNRTVKNESQQNAEKRPVEASEKKPADDAPKAEKARGGAENERYYPSDEEIESEVGKKPSATDEKAWSKWSDKAESVKSRKIAEHDLGDGRKVEVRSSEERGEDGEPVAEEYTVGGKKTNVYSMGGGREFFIKHLGANPNDARVDDLATEFIKSRHPEAGKDAKSMGKWLDLGEAGPVFTDFKDALEFSRTEGVKKIIAEYAKPKNPGISPVEADEQSSKLGRRVRDRMTPKAERAGSVKDFVAHHDAGTYPLIESGVKIARPTKGGDGYDAYNALPKDVQRFITKKGGMSADQAAQSASLEKGGEGGMTGEELVKKLADEYSAYDAWRTGKAQSGHSSLAEERRGRQETSDEMKRRAAVRTENRASAEYAAERELSAEADADNELPKYGSRLEEGRTYRLDGDAVKVGKVSIGEGESTAEVEIDGKKFKAKGATADELVRDIEKIHGEVREQMDARTTAAKLSDAEFKAWAAKKGVAPTRSHREIYDREQAKGAAQVVKRWIKGVNVEYRMKPDEIPDGARMIYSADRKVIGTYDPSSKKVTLFPGANAETVAHEIGWHATYDHAKELAAQGDTRLLDKLREYSNNAPDWLKRDTLAKYGIGASPDVLMDEVGAARFTLDHVTKIQNEVNRREAMKWYEKAWQACKDAYKSVLSARGYNRASIDVMDRLTAERAVEYMAKEMAAGSTIGKVEKLSMDVNSKETKQEAYIRKMKDSNSPLAFVDRLTGGRFSVHREAKLVHGEKQKAYDRGIGKLKKIAEDMRSADIKFTELDEYMSAKGADARNRYIKATFGRENGSGISDADAARTVLQYERGPKGAEIKRIAGEVWKLQHEALMERVRAGLISADFARRLEQAEPFHVPRHSRFDEQTGEFLGYDHHVDVTSPEWKAAKGRRTEANNAVGWIMREYMDAFDRSADNGVRQRLAMAVASNPALGRIVKITSANSGDLQEIKTKGAKGNAQVVAYKNNGEKFAIVLNGTRGELVARAMTGRGIVQTPQWLKRAMRFWSSTATEYSPTFALRNFTADLADIMSVNIGDHGLKEGLKRDFEHVKNFKQLFMDVGHYAKTGETNNPLLKRYIKDGGLIGGMGNEGFTDPAEIQRKINGVFGTDFDISNESQLKKIKAKGLAGGKFVMGKMFGWVATVNKTAELINRLADYKTQIDRGMNGRDAALHARELTVDFNQKGELTPITNALYMFSNSTLGAACRQVKALSRHPNAVVGSMLGWGFAEGLMEHFMNRDDKDREKTGEATGRDVNEFTRANSIYWRRGGTVVRTPFHAGPLSVIKYAGNCAARVMTGDLKPGEAAYNTGKELVGLITHFTGLSGGGANLGQTLTPTILQPFMQALQNRDYADRPIVKPKFDESKPSSANGRRSTPDFYKEIAAIVNSWGGGNESRKSALDAPPEYYQMFIENLGKNALKDVTSVAQTVATIAGLKDFDLRATPIARDYVRTNQSGNGNRFYQAMQKYRDDRYEWTNRAAKMTADERRQYLKDHPWASNSELSKVFSRIQELQKFEDGMVKDGRGKFVERKNGAPSEEKKEAWRAARLKMQARFIEIARKYGDFDQ